MSIAAMSWSERKSRESRRVFAALTRCSGGQSKASAESADFRGFKKPNSEMILELSMSDYFAENRFLADFSPRILPCKETIASSRASGRGGQPLTYMSTGIILSTP